MTIISNSFKGVCGKAYFFLSVSHSLGEVYFVEAIYVTVVQYSTY
jgi:hypothetical protein